MDGGREAKLQKAASFRHFEVGCVCTGNEAAMEKERDLLGTADRAGRSQVFHSPERVLDFV